MSDYNGNFENKIPEGGETSNQQEPVQEQPRQENYGNPEQQENGYVSPKIDVTQFFEEDVIRTSNYSVGDEDFDVGGDAVPFD